MSATTTDTATAAVAPTATRRAALAGAARPQVTVLGGQLVAGVGNLAFAALAAHVLGGDLGGYADVATFLALYLLLHLPAAALAAAGAVAPQDVARHRDRVRVVGAGAAVLLALASPLVAALAGLPVLMAVALAAAAPGAALLGLERGIAYGSDDVVAVARSLVAEPAARVVLGGLLAWSIGPVGAAAGVVAAGYVALATLHATPRTLPPAGPAPSGVRRDVALATAAAFVLVAVLQVQDLVVANRTLAAADAARYGVLSTIGGAAVFATATIPMVLLPAAARARSSASSVALALAGGVGVVIALGGALLATPLGGLFGDEYRGRVPYVGVYLVAMALLGVSRVLVAHHCATGRAGAAAVAVGAVTLLDLVLLGAVGDTPGRLVGVTLGSVALLAVVLTLPDVATHVDARRLAAAVADRVRSPEALALGALCVVATVVRVIVPRGLWVDEAISVRQAQLPFGEMLTDLRTTDVHPPLHHALLWVTVRLFGTSELAVRLPSLIAGVALVPVIWWAGRVLFDRRTGWIAAGLATFAPFCVWYSQEARMYSLFMLFGAVALGAQVLAVRDGRWRWWVLYGVSSALMLWTQYFALLPIAVQQAAFGAVLWRRWRRGDRDGARRFVCQWLLAIDIVLVAAVALSGILHDQVVAYGNRSSGLVPSQAGTGSSTVGSTISIYAVGANLIWAVWGYHADTTMEQLAALWPLGMLAVLVLLGRGRSGRSLLLAALVVVPLAALFAVGSVKRDLFELRYFSGAVPAALLLGARFVTATTRRTVAVAVAGGALVASMAVGLVDQQLNGANPRRYDFESALATISARAEPGDVVLYEPTYLRDVVDYYAPDLTTAPLDRAATVVHDGQGVWVVATDRVIGSEATAAKVGDALARLETDRTEVDRFERPNVNVWELR